jgi:methionyl-tRNA synthetase
MSKAFYVTTTLPYVNDKPHMGHALEFVQADILARYRTLAGDEVFFNTGTDEHGLKIFRKAQEEGKEIQAYVDEYAATFRSLKERLNLHPDLHFIRTTDAHHVRAAQEFWKRCEKDIYKKAYKGLYCVGDEAFVKESDLVNGRCPNHPTMDLIEIEEENYFFALSKYKDSLLEYLAKDGIIVPEWRRQEAINFVNGGLEDFSISRVKDRLPWGVPVPNDDTQVMYVWFDALVNYISTLGWPDEGGDYKKFWVNGETLQLAGKDQVRFQSIMWQAMLMSAGLDTTDKVLYHGFITSDGKKMSKSVGNVVDPIAIIDEYGADALRYFLARHISPFEDSDFTMEKFKEVYNGDLANGIGNLVARVIKMAIDYEAFDDSVAGSVTDEAGMQAGLPDYGKWLNIFNYSAAIGEIWHDIGHWNQFVQEKQPFVVFKTNPDQARKDVWVAARAIFRIGRALKPFLPETSEKIEGTLKSRTMPPSLFPRKE